MKLAPLFSKRVIDPINTGAWFLMDALWLLKLAWPAYVAAALTVTTGILLLVLGWREGRTALLSDLGLNCWIAMNTLWCVNDLSGREVPRGPALVVAVLGAVFFLAATYHSQDMRRVRIVGRQPDPPPPPPAA